MAQGITLSSEIAASLRTEILSRRYREGDRLPSERELAARFAANRGAVREALSQLEQIGLIQVRRGGARVRAIDAASIAILGPLLALDEVPDPALLDQFLQTFGALAALTIREAVAVATVEQLQQLQSRLVALRGLGGDLEAFQPKWVEFLEVSSTIADNLVVRLIGNDLKAQFVGQTLKSRVKPRLGKKVLREILRVLTSAVAERDKEAASVAVTRYFDEIRLVMMQDLENRIAS